jgi:hypothetical protein
VALVHVPGPHLLVRLGSCALGFGSIDD